MKTGIFVLVLTISSTLFAKFEHLPLEPAVAQCHLMLRAWGQDLSNSLRFYIYCRTLDPRAVAATGSCQTDPFALSQTLRAACERAATGQRGLANNRRAQIFADAFLSTSCSDRDPNSPSNSIFCPSPGLAVAWPAQPGAAALMEKLLVLFLQG